MDWSEDQLEATRALRDSIRGGAKASVLTGWAGTGKTTLLRQFSEQMLDDGWHVFWAAPTGKAATRLSSVTGHPASTLHSLLYKRVVEGRSGQPLFGERRQQLLDGQRGLLVVDESSMVGRRLYDDLVASAGTSVQLLFAGDPGQLSPVADQLGPNLSNPTAHLSNVHRQALESPILLVATEVRQGIRMRRESFGENYVRRSGTAIDVADWIGERITAKADAVVLTATNKIRHNVNRLARQALGFTDSIYPGEQLVVLLNNRWTGKMNGDTLRVEACSPVCGEDGEDTGLYRVFADGEVYFVHAPSIGKEVLDFKAARSRLSFLRDERQFLHVDYGYALTPWKAQGSEFKEVCFLVDEGLRWRAGRDPEEAKRLAYTAVTRAKEKLLVLDV